MQDLTSGSLTGHLLKTTSFMLVSMIFQTLYILGILAAVLQTIANVFAAPARVARQAVGR